MAIYTNLDLVDSKKHGMFESSRLKATNCGAIYDVIVRDDTDTEIDVDNGVAIKLGGYTREGLQTRFATIAEAGDKIAVTGSPAIVKDAFTKQQEAEYNFYHEAGTIAKAYEVLDEDYEVFAVASYQFTSGTPAVDAYVVVDGNGGWKIADADPTATNGFVGKVHSIASNGYYPMVRIEVIQNKQI
jgi:hypothetical protein